jgi:hypothetical protein
LMYTRYQYNALICVAAFSPVQCNMGNFPRPLARRRRCVLPAFESRPPAWDWGIQLDFREPGRSWYANTHHRQRRRLGRRWCLERPIAAPPA